MRRRRGREVDPWLDPENRWVRALGFGGRPPVIRVRIVNASNIRQLLRAMTTSSCEDL